MLSYHHNDSSELVRRSYCLSSRDSSEWKKLVPDSDGDRLGITFTLEDLRRVTGGKLGSGSSITDHQFLFLRMLYVGDLVRYGFITMPALEQARNLLRRKGIKRLISLGGNAAVLEVDIQGHRTN